jgi:hypothetical protein
MAVEAFGSGGGQSSLSRTLLNCANFLLPTLDTIGFSWDFEAPAYQQASVAHYLKEAKAKLPFWFQYNAKGRATPDVSALGIGFAVVVNGVTNEASHTFYIYIVVFYMFKCIYGS